MWFVFILGPAAFAGLAAILGLTGGGKFAIVAILMDQWQRHKGYKPGEGVFTPRDGGFHGTHVSPENSHDLGHGLGLLATLFPKEFEPYINKSFELTKKTEGELLRTIWKPAEEALKLFVQSKTEWDEAPEDEEKKAIMEADLQHLRELTAPILKYLEQFPPSRVKPWMTTRDSH